MQLQTKISEELKSELSTDIRSIKKVNKTTIFKINRTIVDKFAKILSGNLKIILSGIFCFPREESYDLCYLYSLDALDESTHFLVKTILSTKVNTLVSITNQFSNAQAYEKRITNEFGINFVELDKEQSVQPVLNPISIAFEKSYASPHQQGIFNPIHSTAYYFEGSLSEDRIQEISLRDGFLHKNRLKEINEKNLNDISSLMSSLGDIDPSAPLSYQSALCLLYESMLNIRISNRISYIRMFLLEFERILHYVDWFIDLFFLLDRKIEVNQLLKLHKRLMNLKIRFIDVRKDKNSRLISLGGCFNIIPDDAIEMFQSFDEAIEKIFSTIYRNLFHRTCKHQLMNLNKISMDNCLRFGLSGPALRANGYLIDKRYTSPYLRYTTGAMSNVWSVIASQSGDDFSRAQQRLWELRESWKICKFILKDIAKFDETTQIKIPKKLKFPRDQLSYQMVEGPRGPIIVIYNADSKITKNQYVLSIIGPSLSNYYSLDKILNKNATIQNLRILSHTLDISFKELDM